MRKSRRQTLLTVLPVLLLFSFSSLHAAALDEYQVKAGFLFQFTKFIEWPQTAQQDSFAICVTGHDPLVSVLNELDGEKVKGRTVKVKKIKVARAGECQMLFISKSEEKRLGDILSAVKGKGILTVSDAAGFLDQGGMVRFLMQGNKIRFEINNKEAQSSGLQISSKLLNIASRVVSA